MAFVLIKATHDNERVILWCRDERGGQRKVVITDFKPYFYVPDERGEFLAIDGKRVRRIEAQRPSEVPQLRANYKEHYEADIPFARRFLIDSGIRYGFELEDTSSENEIIFTESRRIRPIETPYEPYILYLDIEVYSSGDKLPDPADPKARVTSISMITNKGEEVSCLLDPESVISEEPEPLEEDEGKLLLAFSGEEGLLRFISKLLSSNPPDVITGWNIQFDIQYLKDRCHRLNIPFSISFSNDFDLLKAYKAVFRKASNKLRDVVYEEGIANFREEPVDYAELYDTDKKGLFERNRRHARWCYEIDKKHNLVGFYWDLKAFVGLESLDNALTPSILIDTLMLRAYKGKYVLSSKTAHEHESYEGAIVLDPKPGLFEGVAVYDVSSYYPHVILSEKLDPALIYKFGREELKQKGWEEYRSFVEREMGRGVSTPLLDIVRELLQMKDKTKKEDPRKYQAVKAVVNSVYGVYASPYFRLYIPELAARVTEVARSGLREVVSEVEKKGFLVVRGDTDSLFLKVDKEEAEALVSWMNELIREKLKGEYEFKLDKYYVKLLSSNRKKRYAGLKEDGTLDIVGFEYVRGDAAKITQIAQEQVMKLILEGKREELVQYLLKLVSEFKTVPLDQIAIPKTLSKDLGDYKVASDYIRGAKFIVKKFGGEMKAGDRIYMLYVIHPQTNVISVPDPALLDNVVRELSAKVNYERMLERCLLKPLEPLLEFAQLEWDEILQARGRQLKLL